MAFNQAREHKKMVFKLFAIESIDENLWPFFALSSPARRNQLFFTDYSLNSVEHFAVCSFINKYRLLRDVFYNRIQI